MEVGVVRQLRVEGVQLRRLLVSKREGIEPAIGRDTWDGEQASFLDHCRVAVGSEESVVPGDLVGLLEIELKGVRDPAVHRQAVEPDDGLERHVTGTRWLVANIACAIPDQVSFVHRGVIDDDRAEVVSSGERALSCATVLSLEADDADYARSRSRNRSRAALYSASSSTPVSWSSSSRRR